MTRRDVLRCQTIYDDALALHNATGERYGGIAARTPEGVTVSEMRRAWQLVADAWEVAEDACREAEPNKEARRLAEGAHAQSNNIIAALRNAYVVRHVPADDRIRAERQLKLAQRSERRFGFDHQTWSAYDIAARAFADAGASRRARAIQRYIRLRLGR